MDRNGWLASLLCPETPPLLHDCFAYLGYFTDSHNVVFLFKAVEMVDCGIHSALAMILVSCPLLPHIMPKLTAVEQLHHILTLGLASMKSLWYHHTVTLIHFRNSITIVKLQLYSFEESHCIQLSIVLREWLLIVV